jgi:hypothetical protein
MEVLHARERRGRTVMEERRTRADPAQRQRLERAHVIALTVD